MKRFSKVLALCTLLAALLSVFGIFSAFAENGAALSPTVIYDMDTNASLSVSKSTTVDRNGAKVSSPSITKKTDANGDAYWLIETNVKEGEVIGDGSVPYVTLTPGIKPVFRDYMEYTKDTDFMVIDLDVASDDTFIEYLELSGRSYNVSNKNGAYDYNSTDGAPRIDAGVYDDLRVTQSKTSENDGYTIVKSDNEWVNVTLVYDFRVNPEASDADTNWRCHVYIDGYYATTLRRMTLDNKTYRYYTLLLRLPTVATQDYQSTKVRNFTITTYPVGWTGDLADSAKLAQSSVTLREIDNLSYCLDGTNAKRDSLLATVARDGEQIDLTDARRLSAVLADGDTVTLHKSLNTTVIVPKGANITWNANGYALPEVTEVDYNGADAIFTDYSGSFVAAVSGADFITAVKSNGDKDIRAFLLRDITAQVTSPTEIRGKLAVDLNGHKLTLTGSSNVFTPGDRALIRFTGGSLAVNVDSNSSLALMNNSAYFFVENMSSITSDGTLFDQLAGCVRIFGCEKIETAKMLADLKSGGSAVTKFEISGADCTVNSGSAFSVGKGGFVNTRLLVDSCTVNAPMHLVALDAGQSSASVDNDFALAINNSEINVGGNVLDGNLGGKALDIDMSIVSSDIKASYLLAQIGNGVSTDYKYSAYINVDAANLDLSGASFVDKAITDERATVNMSIKGETQLTTNKVVADGIAGATLDIVAPYSLVNRSLSDEHNYTHVVTTKLAPYPIIVNGEETEMQWYAEDAPSLSDLPNDLLPPPNKYVSYEWIYNNDGAFEAVRTGDIPVSANLVLKNNLTFNVYLPADLDARTYDTVTVNGEAVDVTDVVVEGAAYKLIQLTDVHPAAADEKIRVQLTVYIGGIRIERITKRLSVLDYAAAALESAEVGKDEKALIASVVNYIDKAQDYVGKTSSAVDAVVSSDAYKNALPELSGTSSSTNTVSSLGVFDSVYMILDSSFVYNFVTKSDFVGTVSVSYLKDGSEVTESFEVDGMDVISVRVDARDLLGAIKITVGTSTAEYTAVSYLQSVSASYPQAATLANAILLYATEARAFAAK